MDLYANEYKVQPKNADVSKSKKSKSITNQFVQDNNSFYNLPANIKIPKTQIVYR